MALPAHNQQLFRVTIGVESGGAAGTPVTGIFGSAFDGAGYSRATEMYGDPEKSVMRTLAGFIDHSEVTFTALYTPDKVEFIDLLSADKKAPGRYTVTLVPVKDTVDGEPIGSGWTLTGCLITDAKYPSLNRDQVGKSLIVIKLKPDDISYGSSTNTVQN